MGQQPVIPHTDADINCDYVEHHGNRQCRPAEAKQSSYGSDMEQQHETKHQPVHGLLLDGTAKYVSLLNVLDLPVRSLHCLGYFLLYELLSVRRVLCYVARIHHLDG
jgi:hypothetical protein